MYQVTSNDLFNIFDPPLQCDHHSLISTSTKCKYFLLHPSQVLRPSSHHLPFTLLSTSKPFLAIFTILSHQVMSCVESSIHLYCCLFHFNLASFKYETIPYAIPHVSLFNSYELAFTQYMKIPQQISLCMNYICIVVLCLNQIVYTTTHHFCFHKVPVR